MEGSQTSHHYSSPDFGFPHGDARFDLTDLYAFPKPGDATKSILIMNVHPSASYNPPGPTLADPFSTEALYEFKIDTDGDAVADLTYQVQFSAAAGGAQIAALRRVESTQATPNGGQVIVDAAPVSMARAARITEAGEYRFFAGWRSEPFFFDANGAMNHLRFTGDDFFADKDVRSIVLELPNAALGRNKLGLWARTLDRASGGWVQADRGGRRAQAIFLTGDELEAYLAAEPADDAQFIPVFAHSLEHAAGYAPEEIRRVARALLPDILIHDSKLAASYPESGSTAYSYDTLNRLTSLAPPSAFGSGSFGFSYNALSRRTQMTRPNSVTTNYAYDNLSRLTSVLHQLSGSTIDGASYTLDSAGNRTAKTDQLAAVTSNYTYDAIYQLTQVPKANNTTESYSYDPVGNRTASLGVSSYTTYASNELTATSSASYAYDSNGNTAGGTPFETPLNFRVAAPSRFSKGRWG